MSPLRCGRFVRLCRVPVEFFQNGEFDEMGTVAHRDLSLDEFINGPNEGAVNAKIVLYNFHRENILSGAGNVKEYIFYFRVISGVVWHGG